MKLFGKLFAFSRLQDTIDDPERTIVKVNDRPFGDPPIGRSGIYPPTNRADAERYPPHGGSGVTSESIDIVGPSSIKRQKLFAGPLAKIEADIAHLLRKKGSVIVPGTTVFSYDPNLYTVYFSVVIEYIVYPNDSDYSAGSIPKSKEGIN